MKKIPFLSAALPALLMILCPTPELYSQDSISQKSQMLDVKLQLLDSKLDLLDTKIKLWEAKPKELDAKLTEISRKVSSLDFDPVQMNRKITEIDSMYKVHQKAESQIEERFTRAEKQETVQEQPELFPVYNSAIMLDPARLLEGTFSLSYERVLSNKFSANASILATYSTKQGLSNFYFSNQSFAIYNDISRSYENYNGEVMSGAGINLQLRNYLLAEHSRRVSPLGLYAAPQIMYRHLKITGYTREHVETEPGLYEWTDRQVVQNLDVIAGGVVLGYKLPLFRVLAIDIFAGGNIRLSKYFREKGFTKYKDWSNFDFSGVSPVAGITIGILK
jgi:hypothetical protein